MAQQYYLQSSLVANTQRSDRFRVISGTQSISDNFNDQQVQDYLQFSPALGYVFENQNLLEIAFLGGYHTESYLNEDATAMLPITGFKAHRPHFSTIVSYLYGFDKKKRRFRPFLGASAETFFHYHFIDPKTSSSFKFSDNKMGMGLYLQGKLQYYFQPNLCLTFSVPFPLFYAFLQTQKSRNPILSIREQITRSHHFIALPKDYQASIGLTWQIIKKDKGK